MDLEVIKMMLQSKIEVVKQVPPHEDNRSKMLRALLPGLNLAMEIVEKVEQLRLSQAEVKQVEPTEVEQSDHVDAIEEPKKEIYGAQFLKDQLRGFINNIIDRPNDSCVYKVNVMEFARGMEKKGKTEEQTVAMDIHALMCGILSEYNKAVSKGVRVNKLSDFLTADVVEIINANIEV